MYRVLTSSNFEITELGIKGSLTTSIVPNVGDYLIVKQSEYEVTTKVYDYDEGCIDIIVK